MPDPPLTADSASETPGEPVERKRCTGPCGLSKRLCDFYLGPNGKPIGYCKACKIAAVAAYRKRHPDVARNWHLKARYGISSDRYREMASRQRGLCAICEERRKLVVDHCHVSGRVRQLLCESCNFLLGHCGESETRLLNAIAYLKRHAPD